MSFARATSTSTRDAVAPPARKNRFRIAPVTSTMSPSAQVATDLLTRPFQTAQSRLSER